MTISELIAILSKYDGNMTILVEGYEYGLSGIEARFIYESIYYENHNSASFAGPHQPDPNGGHIGIVIGRGG